MQKLQGVVGRTEKLELVDYGGMVVDAKIDTGADVSSIWASKVREKNGSLSFILFGKGSPYYTGQVISVNQPDYRRATFLNSFGGRERRFVVKLRIRLQGRLIKASFSLADRSKKTYSVLLGRRLLYKKFSVDVALKARASNHPRA